VVADLLTIARGVAAVKENVCLNTLVEEYLASPEHQKLCGAFLLLTCPTHLATGLWTTSCSTVHIQKCLMNLIYNGAEALVAGKAGTITLASRNEFLQGPLPGFPEISCGKYVVLTVADNGMGIDGDDLAHIFEPFYTKKAMGRSGTGLGLTVVWNTMQDHRGAVTVESTHANGTVFSLYLPATEEALSLPSASAVLAELRGSGQHILIVDDEPQQRDIARQILCNLNYQPQAVASGEEAAVYLKHHTAELVILDMIMPPGINGRQTFELILAINAKQKAIIVSGFADSEEVAILQGLGAQLFIKKPYTLEELGKAVQMALR
jgi:CheY-like chemotaxis protein